MTKRCLKLLTMFSATLALTGCAAGPCGLARSLDYPCPGDCPVVAARAQSPTAADMDATTEIGSTAETAAATESEPFPQTNAVAETGNDAPLVDPFLVRDQ